MSDYLKKIAILFFVIFALFLFLSFGANYIGKYTASLSGIITAWVTINPLEVNVSAPAEVEINKTFKVEAKLINKGEEKIENARGEIFLPPELVLLKKDPVQEIGVIPGKKTKKISWAVRGEKEGNYVITVSASGELKGELVQAGDSTVVKVKPSLQRKNLWQWFREFLSFFRLE